MGVESACQEGAARGVAWRHRAVRPAGDRRTRERGDVQPERHSDEGAYGAACVRRRQGRRRGRGREGEHQGARPVRGRDRRLARGRLAVAGSVRGGRRGEDAPGDSRQLERDHEAAVPQRPGQPRGELRRRLGVRHRPDDRVHRRRRRPVRRAASGGVWRTTNGGAQLDRAQQRPATAAGRGAGDRSSRRLGDGGHRRGEQRLGEPVRRRRVPARQRIRHLDAGRRRRAGRRRVLPDRLDQRLSVRGDQPRSVAARRVGLRLDRVAAGAASRSEPEQLAVPHVVHHRRDRGAGTAAQDPGRRRLGRLRRRTGVDPVQRVLRGHRRRGKLPPHHAAGRHQPGHHRADDVLVVAAAGYTPSCRTPRPTRSSARVHSCRRAAARPGRGR